LSIVAPRVSRYLQLYPSNCIQWVPEKLAVAALPRKFHTVNETRQFIKIFTAFGTGSYPEPDTSNPLLVPIQSQTHPVRYWSLTSAKCIQAATGPNPEPYISSPPYKTLATLK